MTKRQSLRLLAFLLSAVLLTSLLSELLRSRSTTFSAVYSEPDQTVDVLIVGSSHVNSGYIPSMLWEQNHLSAVNAYSWSQPMWISYHYIVEALKTQSPSVIVLEAFGMTYGHSYIMPQEIDKTNYANSYDLDLSWNRLQMIATSAKCGLDLRDPEEFLSLVHYHDRWQHLTWADLTYNAHDQHDYLKGYGLLLTSEAAQDPALTFSPPLQPYEYAVEYLEKIVALCQEKNIRLVLTMAPYLYGQEETGIYTWLEEYCAARNIPFFNYNGEDGRRIGFDFSTDLADNGHCNYYGAVKLTQDLCDYLTATTEQRTKEEHAAYPLLADDFRRYSRVITLNELMAQSSLDDWLALALADPDVTLYLNDTGRNPEASQVLADQMQLANIQGGPIRQGVLKGGLCQKAEGSISADLFGKAGTVTFVDDSCQILLNRREAPGENAAAMKLILYDTVLQRPVQAVTVAEQGLALSAREFTSDILDLFR